jgi:hypothetical protein
MMGQHEQRLAEWTATMMKCSDPIDLEMCRNAINRAKREIARYKNQLEE